MSNWKINLTVLNTETGEKEFYYNMADSEKVLEFLEEIDPDETNKEMEYSFVSACIYNNTIDPQDYEDEDFDTLESFKNELETYIDNNLY